MSDITVSIGKDITRKGVLINPNANAGDIFNQETGQVIEGNNTLAEGDTARAALAKYYGR